MDERELRHEADVIAQKTDEIVVRDADTYSIAGNIILSLNRLTKQITEYWADPIDKAFQAHRALTDKRSEMLAPIGRRRSELTKKMNVYVTEQERIRREEQRKVDEARRKQEDDERRRLEARAQKAKEKGKLEKAEELREKAAEVFIPPVIVVPEVEKTTRTDAGTISASKDIEIEITDEMEIVKAIAAGRLSLGVIEIKTAKLKSDLKNRGIRDIPGVIIREVVKTKFRSA